MIDTHNIALAPKAELIKWVGIKFLLEHSHFMMLVFTEDEANNLLKTLSIPQPDGSTIAGTVHAQSPMGAGMAWVIRRDTIEAFHTFNVSEQVAAMRAQTQQNQGWGMPAALNPKSGI